MTQTFALSDQVILNVIHNFFASQILINEEDILGQLTERILSYLGWVILNYKSFSVL